MVIVIHLSLIFWIQEKEKRKKKREKVKTKRWRVKRKEIEEKMPERRRTKILDQRWAERRQEMHSHSNYDFLFCCLLSIFVSSLISFFGEPLPYLHRLLSPYLHHLLSPSEKDQGFSSFLDSNSKHFQQRKKIMEEKNWGERRKREQCRRKKGWKRKREATFYTVLRRTIFRRRGRGWCFHLLSKFSPSSCLSF